MANTRTRTNTTSGNRTAEQKTEPRMTEEKIVPKEIDMNQYVVVRNGFQGTLVYVSPRTGERFIWDGFGTEQEMELRELKNAKSANKRFFTDNLFMFEDDWVVDFLGVRQFYKNAIPIEEFDEIFKKSPLEIKKTVSALSAGQKKSVAYRAREMIASGEIDSRKTISALEDALGVELIEK